MSQCKISLENYNETYYPGSEIKGRVECYFEDQTFFRDIKILLKCEEYNEWTGAEQYVDPIDGTRKTRYKILKGGNKILRLEQLLAESGNDRISNTEFYEINKKIVILGSGSHAISGGRHVYTFQFILPTDIPSSYTGPHGSIVFSLKAVVNVSLGFDYEDEFVFVVFSPIDLNRMPKELQDPASYSDEKTVCCWCCQGGNVTMDVEIAKTAFVPGEIVPLKVRVCNLSNSNVENVSVRFTKVVAFETPTNKSNKEYRRDEEEIFSRREHGVGAHSDHTFDMRLQIPRHIDVPNFTRCQRFKVDYVMTVSCEMPSWTLDLDVEIRDIQLGHVQWRGGPDLGSNSPSNMPPIDCPMQQAPRPNNPGFTEAQAAVTSPIETPPPSYDEL